MLMRLRVVTRPASAAVRMKTSNSGFARLAPLAMSTTDAAERREITAWLQHRIKTLVGISTRGEVLAPDSIERTLTGKAKRVVDSRPR